MGSLPKPAHILVFPFPAQGHVNVAMNMSRKLASQGLDITFVCTEHYISRMHTQGFDAGDLPIRLIGLADGLPPSDRVEQVSVLVDATEKMRPVLEQLLERLIEEGARRSPVCIIYDFMLWWIKDVAKLFNIPGYSLFPMSGNFLSFLLYVPYLVSQSRLPLRSTDDFSAASELFKIPGFPALHASELPDVASSPNPVCTFEFILRCAASMHDASGVLINTVYELEHETIEAVRKNTKAVDFRALGPLVPSSLLNSGASDKIQSDTSLSGADRKCLEWLDMQPASSVLYVAFGTVASLSAAQILELALGLEASQQRFLWVVRIPFDYSCESGDFQQSISSFLPEGFEARIKNRGFIVLGWAPQPRVLTHPATGGFLTHCGWNSTLESICAGVPLVCWPIYADQGMNSKFLLDVVKLGHRFSKREDGMVDKGEVERVVRLLMEGKEGKVLKSKAGELKETVRRAVKSGGSSHEGFHNFVQEMVERSQAGLLCRRDKATKG